MNDRPTSLLRVEGITRVGHDGKQLLGPTTLSLQVGDFVVCQGSSGSGKSVLLRAIAMLDPVQGSVSFRGQIAFMASVPRYRSQVMYVHQTTSLPEGTVESALREPFEWKAHHAVDFDQPRAVALLERFGRDESFLGAQLSHLSGGEAQLVALVRTLQLDPTILLLDEPMSAMDPEATARVERVLVEWLRDDERAIVMVTHSAAQAGRLATRHMLVRDGEVSVDD